MFRWYFPIGVAIILVIGLFAWLAPAPGLAALPAAPGPAQQLNSEGDEWVLVDPQQAAPVPPAPEALVQAESTALAVLQPAVSLPGPEAALGLSLDLARQGGPLAVLAFIANQPDPRQPLLVAAAADAQQELTAKNSPVVAAPNAANWAALNSGPCAFATLQAAVDASAPGDIVLAASGVYTENIDITGKVLTIVGGYDSNCTAPIPAAKTEIHASTASSVVDVSGASVATLRNLDISGGASFGAGVDLLGSSIVILDNTDVHDNHGASGGGLYIGGTSAVTITNNADIYDNTASAGGGAIVYGKLFGYTTDSDIYGNSSTTTGGGLYVNNGSVMLNNADVVANTATGDGGGIYILNGTLNLANSVFVGETAPCCQSAVNGGGIYASASQVTIDGTSSTVMNNTATGNGGGIYLVNGSRLDFNGGRLGLDNLSVSGNDAVLGAGMYVDGSQVTFSGVIVNNIASNSGGGVYATSSTLTMTQATVGGTQVHSPNKIGATGLNGAGLYLFNNTRMQMDDTLVISNTLTNPATGYGGGIYIRQGSVLTMTTSRVEQHRAPSAFDGRGAGLYIFDASVTLNDTLIGNNTAANFGGGVRMFGVSVLNILDGSIFANNRALGGNGGGIAATNTPDINAVNAAFQDNQASGHGGAVYQDAGTLDFTGSLLLTHNTAGGDGGALALVGTANAGLVVTAGPGASMIANNQAAGSGGAVYLGNNSTLEMYATQGYPLSLQGNSAGANGGAAFAGAGGFFDVYGDVTALSNSATGNGGAFYLSAGSRIWMDDFFNVLPALAGNHAANGGAIYALNSPRVECDGVRFGTSQGGNTAMSGSGGAIYLDTSTLNADNCFFRGNQALAGDGGAIAAQASTVTVAASVPNSSAPQPALAERAAPSAPLATACLPASQECSGMVQNNASLDGGAIYSNNSTVTLEQTILRENSAQRGGAIFQEGAGAVGSLENVLVAENSSSLAFGAGIRNAGGTFTIWHGTLAHNTGGAGYSSGASTTSSIYNTIIWGNSVGAFGAIATSECSIDQAGVAGPAANPKFLSPGQGLYRPGLGSPALDACVTGSANDLLGALRPIGVQFDMGAYEVRPPVFLPFVQR